MDELEDLILKAKNKDKNAFEQIIFSIENDLYRIAQTRLNNIEDINDAIQETVIIAFKSIKKLRSPIYFKTWIIKILINECNKIYKSRSKNLKLFNKIIKNKNEYTDDYIDIIEQKIELENILNLLNYDEKLAITLHYNEKYSIAQIAELLNICPNTIRSRIARAKEKIKAYNNGGVTNGRAK